MSALGYARAVGRSSSLELQTSELQKAGVDAIFADSLKAGRHGFPELNACLSSLGPGDVLVVTSIDNLPRGVPALVDVVRRVRDRNADFRELAGRYDTTRPGGRTFFEWIDSIAGRLE